MLHAIKSRSSSLRESLPTVSFFSVKKCTMQGDSNLRSSYAQLSALHARLMSFLLLNIVVLRNLICSWRCARAIGRGRFAQAERARLSLPLLYPNYCQGRSVNNGQSPQNDPRYHTLAATTYYLAIFQFYMSGGMLSQS